MSVCLCGAQPEGGMMHVFSLSSGGKCEVPIRGLAGGKLPCYNEVRLL